MTANTYDAIVVGSGISGGWAAKELTEKGLNTLVLEAGRPIDPAKDYVETVQVWELRFRGLNDRKWMDENQFVQQRSWSDEWTNRFFINDKDNPYTTDPDKPFLWIRGRQVGGRSITWGRQSYRWGEQDFEANAREDIGVDWPIRYRDIAPWYDYVEDFIGVSGQAEGLPQVPDGRFLPPMPLNCAEEVVRDAIAKHFGGERRLTIGRAAILTVPHRGRAACHYCGPCPRGCHTRSYFSSLNCTLPAAEATGRLTLRPFSVVHSLTFDAKRRRVTGVKVVDGQTRETLEFRARAVFLCASALESTRILLNSATPEFPTGLANSSGELGRHLMDHPMGAGARGTIPGLLGHRTFGNRPNGIYVPRFRNINGKKSAFLRGYQFQGSAYRQGWTRGLTMIGFGSEFKKELSELGPWRFGFYGFGECLARRDNYVEIDKDKVDAWGIPVLKIHCTWSENEKAMLQDMAIAAAEMLAAAGARDIEPFIEESPPGLTIHEMGTARMGRDRKTSVLNRWCQAHDVPNLFVTDGACMTSSANQNPSLTYMALTARACHYAVERMKRGKL